MYFCENSNLNINHAINNVGAIMAVMELKKHKLDYIPVGDLRFDPQNPRLNEKAVNYSQLQIFDILEKYFDLMPIAKSMAERLF